MKMLIAALAIASMAGCSKGDTQASVSDGWGEADVKLVTLKDGTRCAALIGAYKGGIHCDWKHWFCLTPRVQPPRSGRLRRMVRPERKKI